MLIRAYLAKINLSYELLVDAANLINWLEYRGIPVIRASLFPRIRHRSENKPPKKFSISTMQKACKIRQNCERNELRNIGIKEAPLLTYRWRRCCHLSCWFSWSPTWRRPAEATFLSSVWKHHSGTNYSELRFSRKYRTRTTLKKKMPYLINTWSQKRKKHPEFFYPASAQLQLALRATKFQMQINVQQSLRWAPDNLWLKRKGCCNGILAHSGGWGFTMGRCVTLAAG